MVEFPAESGANFRQDKDHHENSTSKLKGHNNSTSMTRISHAASKQRKRRSSTSEYIDYTSLEITSHIDTVVYDDVRKETSRSCPAIEKLEHNGSDHVDGGHAVGRGVKKTDSSTSDASNSSGVCSDMSSEREKNGGRKPPYKRQNSCPEHLYTQRMTITNDEERLLEGKKMHILEFS